MPQVSPADAVLELGPGLAPPDARRPGEINVHDLLEKLPADTAARLKSKVDKDHSGHISVDELGELFSELEKDKKTIRALRWEVIVAVVFLGVAIAANYYSATAAVEAGRTTGTKDVGQGQSGGGTTAILTDKEGKELRVNTDLFEHQGMSSQLADADFAELKRFTIEGGLGNADIPVQGFMRLFPAGEAESEVVLFTPQGQLTVDWNGTIFVDDETSELSTTFTRIGLSPTAADIVAGSDGGRSRRGRKLSAIKLAMKLLKLARAPPPPPPAGVWIHTDDGQFKILFSSRSNTITQIKQRIENREGHPTANQVLRLSGTGKLQDGRTLAYYDIADGSHLRLDINIEITSFEITIRLSASVEFTLEVEPTDKIGSVRNKIEDARDIPVELQVLRFGGVLLENGQTLSSYGVEAGSKVFIKVLWALKIKFTDATAQGTINHLMFVVDPSDTILDVKKEIKERDIAAMPNPANQILSILTPNGQVSPIADSDKHESGNPGALRSSMALNSYEKLGRGAQQSLTLRMCPRGSTAAAQLCSANNV